MLASRRVGDNLEEVKEGGRDFLVSEKWSKGNVCGESDISRRGPRFRVCEAE